MEIGIFSKILGKQIPFMNSLDMSVQMTILFKSSVTLAASGPLMIFPVQFVCHKMQRTKDGFLQHDMQIDSLRF